MIKSQYIRTSLSSTDAYHCHFLEFDLEAVGKNQNDEVGEKYMRFFVAFYGCSEVKINRLSPAIFDVSRSCERANRYAGISVTE